MEDKAVQPLTISLMQQNLQHLLGMKVPNPAKVLQEANDERIRATLQGNWPFNFYLAPKILEYAKWLEYSDEGSNFTYELNNLHHLKGWLACVTGADIRVCDRVVQEIIDDDYLIDTLIKT